MAKVSTNIIAKMGKEELISMERVAKICAVFGYTADDILDLDLSMIDCGEEKDINNDS